MYQFIVLNYEKIGSYLKLWSKKINELTCAISVTKTVGAGINFFSSSRRNVFCLVGWNGICAFTKEYTYLFLNCVAVSQIWKNFWTICIHSLAQTWIHLEEVTVTLHDSVVKENVRSELTVETAGLFFFMDPTKMYLVEIYFIKMCVFIIITTLQKYMRTKLLPFSQ